MKDIAEKLIKIIPFNADRLNRKPNEAEEDVYNLAQAYLKLLEENRQLKQLLGMIWDNVKEPNKLTPSQAIFKLEAIELYTKPFVPPTNE